MDAFTKDEFRACNTLPDYDVGDENDINFGAGYTFAVNGKTGKPLSEFGKMETKVQRKREPGNDSRNDSVSQIQEKLLSEIKTNLTVSRLSSEYDPSEFYSCESFSVLKKTALTDNPNVTQSSKIEHALVNPEPDYNESEQSAPTKLNSVLNINHIFSSLHKRSTVQCLSKISKPNQEHDRTLSKTSPLTSEHNEPSSESAAFKLHRKNYAQLQQCTLSEDDNLSSQKESSDGICLKNTNIHIDDLRFSSPEKLSYAGEYGRSQNKIRKSGTETQSSREVHMHALSELQTSSALRARPDVVYGTMIPEPDYSDEEGDSKSSSSQAAQRKVARNNRVNANSGHSSPQKENKCDDDGRFDEKGLILPKKLPNPCLESSDKKSLHRELLFNQKVGINVLNQKSELQKAMEKHKGKAALKEQEAEKLSNLSPLQRAIDERAQRLEKSKEESKEADDNAKITDKSSEFQKIHAKFRSKIEAK